MIGFMTLSDFYKRNSKREGLFFKVAQPSEKVKCCRFWSLLFIDRHSMASELINLFQRRRLSI